MRRSLLRIWGKIEDGEIVPATAPVITCQCIRVPVLNGHTAAVFVKFRKKPTKEQLIEKLVSFQAVMPQETGTSQRTEAVYPVSGGGQQTSGSSGCGF